MFLNHIGASPGSTRLSFGGTLGSDFRVHPCAAWARCSAVMWAETAGQSRGQDTRVIAEADQGEEVGDGVQREDEVGQGPLRRSP